MKKSKLVLYFITGLLFFSNIQTQSAIATTTLSVMLGLYKVYTFKKLKDLNKKIDEIQNNLEEQNSANFDNINLNNQNTNEPIKNGILSKLILLQQYIEGKMGNYLQDILTILI